MTVRRILGVSLVPVLIGLIVVFGRALSSTTYQVDARPTPVVQLDQAAIARRLSAALQFATLADRKSSVVDGQPFIDLHRYLERAFPVVHANLQRTVVGDYSLLYTWPGRDPMLQPILLMAHLDVVPAAFRDRAKWAHAPFAGEIADGFIYGRGALDNKSGVMGILEAAEMLLQDGYVPQRTVLFAFGHDEEVGGRYGNTVIARQLAAEGIQLRFVLDEGGAITQGVVAGVDEPIALVGIAEKGYADFELTTTTVGGHASTPPPQTAIGILAAAVHRLEDNPFPARIGHATDLMMRHLSPEMSLTNRLFLENRWLFERLVQRQLGATLSGNASLRTTMAATIIRAGIESNVLPTHARCVVNVRIAPGDSLSGVLRYLEQTVNDQRVAIRPLDAMTAVNPSRVSSVDCDAFHTIARSIREVFPQMVVAPCQAIHATDSRHYADIADDIYRFLPTRLTKDDLRRIHGVNERIAVDDFANAIRFYRQLLKNATSEEGAGS